MLLVTSQHLRCSLLSGLLIMRYILVPTGLPIHTTQAQLTLTSTASYTSSGRSKRLWPTSEHEGGSSGDPPKRKRSLIYHPNSIECLPCILWRQSGSDPNLKHLHPLKNSRHVGTNAFAFSQYAHYDNVTFNLSKDDCVCHPCHVDFKRKCNQENKNS